MNNSAPPKNAKHRDENTRTDCEGDLASLRKDLNELKAQAADKWKKIITSIGLIGGFLGIASSLIAFPKGIQDARDSWLKQPRTTLHAEAIALEYKPGSSIFLIKFPLVISNEGNDADFIRHPEAVVFQSAGADASKDANSEGFGAGEGKFSFFEKGSLDGPLPDGAIDPPIVVEKYATKSVLCLINFDKGSFTKAGFNRLDVKFLSGDGKKKELSYCFYLDEKQIKDLQGSQLAGTKRFLTNDCGGT